MARVKGTINPKTTSLYKGSYCQLLIEMGKEGKSVTQFCSKVDICEETFYAWCNKYPDFMKAKVQQKVHSKAYWQAYGEGYVTTVVEEKGAGIKFDTNLYKFIVSGRFGMGYAKERDPTETEDFSQGTIKERYEKVMKAVAKQHISPEQATSYIDMIKSAIPIDTHDVLLNTIIALDGQVKELKKMKTETKIADEPDFELIDDINSSDELISGVNSSDALISEVEDDC